MLLQQDEVNPDKPDGPPVWLKISTIFASIFILLVVNPLYIFAVNFFIFL